MEYVHLGRTGMKVSRICLGTMAFGTPEWRSWVLDETRSRPLIRGALDAGINFFDTADMYSDGASERVLGKALREMARREEVVIATKVFHPTGSGVNERGLSRVHILSAIDGSLKRLGTDYIDLYLVHRWDYETPPEETLETLNEIRKDGKVRYIGASSMHAWQFMKLLCVADAHGWARPVAMQNHYNLLYREEEREMLPLCRSEGIAVLPWSPLARGMLAGTYSRDGSRRTNRAETDTYSSELYTHQTDFDIVERVQALGNRIGASSAQIALAWLMHQPDVTSPVVGITAATHLQDALGSLDISLDNDDLRYIEELYVPRDVKGHT